MIKAINKGANWSLYFFVFGVKSNRKNIKIMHEIYLILISTLIILNILSFICGYILGKSNSQPIVGGQSKSFFDQNKSLNYEEKILIDERKYITDIKTSGLEKKYDTLGETKKTDEDIGSSINKLKNLKR